MKRMMLALGALVLALLGNSVQAVEFPVQGSSASGLPGERVFVELVYDYGPSFGVIAEDLQFEYQFANMTFNPGASTIDLFEPAQSLLNYPDSLKPFTALNEVPVNVNYPVPLRPEYKGYNLSFVTDGTPHLRSGIVHLRVAFDILSTALPTSSVVSFTDANLLADDVTEFTYPIALQNLSVTVVPEPLVAWMLLPGLALIGLYSRRRAGRQR